MKEKIAYGNPKEQINVLLLQLSSRKDVQKNFETVEDLLKNVQSGQYDWIVLPEFWPIIGENETDKLAIKEKFLNGPIQDKLRQWSRDTDAVIFGGSIPIEDEHSDKVFNSLLVFEPNGDMIYRYDKIHLFKMGLDNDTQRKTYDESRTMQAGHTLPHNLEINGWKVGLGICFDLRFPEFFLKQSPCDVFVLPSAFTLYTQEHWKIHILSRAIENQAYFLACDQCGLHEHQKSSAGFSSIIDPWGQILAQADESSVCKIHAILDKKRILEIRQKLPINQLHVL